MATRTAKKAAPKTRRKATPEPEVEEEDLDIEETDDEEVEEEPAPKTRGKKPAAKKAAAAPKPETKGTAWLKEHIGETLGNEVESTKLRIVLRKLIKDGTIESPKDGRYQFAGPRDPNVKAVIAALRDEAKSGPAKRGRKPKTKVAPEVEDAEDEVEDLDLDDE